MDSPLKSDAQVIKDFKITNDVDDVYKLGFARTQLDEIKKALWRERVDLITANYQVAIADDDNMKVQHQSKVAEKKMLIKQFVRSVDVLTELVSELEKTVSAE